MVNRAGQRKEKKRELEAQSTLRRQAEKKLKAANRLRQHALIHSAYLPKDLVEKFEVYLSRRMGMDEDRLPSKFTSHWMAAQKIIAECQLDPTDYADQPEVFFKYIIKNKYSPSYLKKVLRLVNLWGFFVCKEQKKAFLPAPPPAGKWRERINETYLEQREPGRESAPLIPLHLEAARSNLTDEHYNWLYLSVWLGLRPSEIDRLRVDVKAASAGKVRHLPSHRIEEDQRQDRKAGRKIMLLKVYQPKLIAVEKAKRWKSIPILYPEQERALAILKSGQYRRPLTRTIHRWLGPEYNTYAGRKGFMDLMLGLGQKFENISLWLGHTTLDRSLRNYKQKGVVHYDLPKKNGRRLRAV